MAYELEGSLLEVCTCKVLCPCWIGEDPDGDGTCDGTLGWHIARGTINGVDVSGLTIAALAHIPGNVLKGNWRAAMYVDDKASPEQQEALLNVFSGKLGGPIADLAGLIGEIVSVERVPITFVVQEGKGSLQIGSVVSAEMEPYRGPTGEVTTLNESIFTTIPGSPAYVAKAMTYKADMPQLGISVDLQGHNAVQGAFRFVG
jgi:hypothetical protein